MEQFKSDEKRGKKMSQWILIPISKKEDYIAHHGIMGQKWGKKNGPPYPLGSSDHSASERKAGWRQSLLDKRKTKQERLRKKEERNNYINKSIEYGKEFQQTQKGKRLKENLSNAYDIYFGSYGKNGEKEFIKSEKEYLTKMGEYEAKKFLQEYDLDKLKELNPYIKFETKSEFIKEYAEESYYVHRE